MSEETLSFAGHQSFAFRNTWLTKGVAGCAQKPDIFLGDDALVLLGVGKNMVQSIRHWCLATQMLDEDPSIKNGRGRQLVPTVLGRQLFLGREAWDPFLEDNASLWLIHWLLVTNTQRATTWRFAFNHFHHHEFSRASLENALVSLVERAAHSRVSADTLRRDIEVFVRTYTNSSSSARSALEDSLDCPLVDLGLIVEQETRDVFAFVRGPKDTLPDAVIAFALADYSNTHPQPSYSFDELAYGPLSPGRVFKLDEPSLVERLERISDLTNGAWQFSDSAGYRQLLLKRSIDRIALLDAFYHSVTCGGSPIESGAAR